MKFLFSYSANLWSKENSTSKAPLTVFLLRFGLIILLYILIDRLFSLILSIPLEAYYQPFIFGSFIEYFISSSRVILIIPLGLFLFYFRKRLLVSWSEFQPGKYIRFFVLLAAGMLAWVFSTSDFNLLLNQDFYFDRLLLILGLLFMYYRPFFVIPYLVILFPFIGQFEALSGFSWAAPFLPIRVLILFSTFYFIYLLTKSFPSNAFVFLLACLFASHYWISGLGKLNLDWVLDDQIYYLLPNTYANGWLGFLPPEKIASITESISVLNLPMKVFTLIVECGLLFLFWGKNSLRFFLGGWILLHLGIWLISGICFWMWMILDAGLLFLFLNQKAFAKLQIFTKRHLYLSIFLILGSAFWCRPVKLAWLDAPLTYTYKFVATTKSGKIYSLPPKFFAPYDYQFTLSAFHYLCPQKILNITWGATGNAEIPRQLSNFESNEEIFKFESSIGQIAYNEKKKIYLEQFLKEFVINWNNRLSKNTLLSFIQAPRLLWTYSNNSILEHPSTIHKITMSQLTTFYKNGKYSEIREIPILEINTIKD